MLINHVLLITPHEADITIHLSFVKENLGSKTLSNFKEAHFKILLSFKPKSI